MSSYEELEYFSQMAGFDHGPEILIACLIAVSIIAGAIIAKCMLGKAGESETKQARKALADVLNEGKAPRSEHLSNTEDDMFDVPLNDNRSYVGPDMTHDALTSEASYQVAPSKPQKPKKKATSSRNQVKVGNLTEDDEYSFDVEAL